MLDRKQRLAEIRARLRTFRIVGLLGPRQVGKTTLAREIAARFRGPSTFFDLERPEDVARLQEPELALAPLRGLVVIDEIQRRSDLFPVLRVLADRKPLPARFLVLGSASPDLLKQSSESLAGRIGYVELAGFDLEEVPVARAERLWLRGGFPLSFLARSEEASMQWRRAFIRDFLERDLADVGLRVPAETMRRFWTMLAHYHGQLWNAAEFARAFGVAETTVRRHLDHLVSTFAVRVLPPWHENLGKRQVRAPRVFVNDSGLLHALLGIGTRGDLLAHPKVGASWEGFALEQVARRLRAEPQECFFWRTHQGAELDLLVVRGRRRLGFEFKRSTAPTMTPSMRSALADLKLDSLTVIHAGHAAFPLAPHVKAVPFSHLLDEFTPLR
ncbi:MAG: ATP-binding protein [Candidatus Eisenbacteria bacterium]|nr:ATP-binding protein [Candidatus Eisenbacteria bacterium]